MNKKAFTLIELIGTVVILSLIVLIITPAISDNVKKGVEDADKTTKENIVLSAKNWASDNKSKLQNEPCVTIERLQREGYIDKDIKLPSNQESITSAGVKITQEQKENKKTYKYEYVDGC